MKTNKRTRTEISLAEQQILNSYLGKEMKSYQPTETKPEEFPKWKSKKGTRGTRTKKETAEERTARVNKEQDILLSL